MRVGKKFDISSASTSVSTVVVGIGNMFVMGIGMIATILLMRTFNPEDYGVIITLITMMTVIPVFMDFGTTASIIRFGPMFEKKGLIFRKNRLFRSMFYLRLILGIALLFVMLFFVNSLSNLFFHSEGYSHYIIFALIGSLFVAFMQFAVCILQSNEQFFAMTGIKLVEAFYKILFVVGLVYYISKPQPGQAILIYATAPLAALFVLGFKIPKELFVGRIDLKELKLLFHFSFWFMVSRVSLMIFMNFDVLFLAAFAQPEEVGYFGSGFKIASILYLVVNAITTVLMPQIGKKLTAHELQNFLKKTIYVCLFLGLCMSPIAAFGGSFIPFIAGEKYIPAIPVFSLVAWDHVAMVIFTPFMLALFAVNRPRLFAAFSLLEMILNVVGDIIFVPLYGAVGAAAVTLSVRIINGVIGSFFMLYKFRSDPDFTREIF